jgi:hypothetical protein
MSGIGNDNVVGEKKVLTRLFTEGSNYTDLGMQIDSEVQHAVEKVMRRYPNVDIRDLQLIVTNAAMDATVAMVLDRKT